MLNVNSQGTYIDRKVTQEHKTLKDNSPLSQDMSCMYTYNVLEWVKDEWHIEADLQEDSRLTDPPNVTLMIIITLIDVYMFKGSLQML